MRLRHKAHGVIANVDDETGRRLSAGAWEKADTPPVSDTADKPPRPIRKKADDAAGDDHTS